MINENFIYTFARGLEIITVCTITGEILDVHTIPEKHDPFVEIIQQAVTKMICDADLMARRFMINKTPFVIQKSGGALTVYVKANQAVYDMFLYVADALCFELKDTGRGFRLV